MLVPTSGRHGTPSQPSQNKRQEREKWLIAIVVAVVVVATAAAAAAAAAAVCGLPVPAESRTVPRCHVGQAAEDRRHAVVTRGRNLNDSGRYTAHV